MSSGLLVAADVMLEKLAAAPGLPAPAAVKPTSPVGRIPQAHGWQQGLGAKIWDWYQAKQRWPNVPQSTFQSTSGPIPPDTWKGTAAWARHSLFGADHQSGKLQKELFGRMSSEQLMPWQAEYYSPGISGLPNPAFNPRVAGPPRAPGLTRWGELSELLPNGPSMWSNSEIGEPTLTNRPFSGDLLRAASPSLNSVPSP